MIPTQMIHPKYAINSWSICPQAIVKLNKIQNLKIMKLDMFQDLRKSYEGLNLRFTKYL